MFPERMITFWLRIKALSRRRQLDRDLDDKLQFHLAMREENLTQEGSPQEDAHLRRAAAVRQRNYGERNEPRHVDLPLPGNPLARHPVWSTAASLQPRRCASYLPSIPNVNTTAKTVPWPLRSSAAHCHWLARGTPSVYAIIITSKVLGAG